MTHGPPWNPDQEAAGARSGACRLCPELGTPHAQGALTSSGHNHSLQGSTKGPRGQFEAFRGKKTSYLLFFFEDRAPKEGETQASGQNGTKFML